MRARVLRGTLAPAGLALLLAAGCAGPTGGDSQAPPPDALWASPGWVLHGCHSGTGGNAADALCGVGSATGPLGPSVLRATAVGRGRTEIARQLFAGVKSVLRELASTADGALELGEGDDRERRIVDVSKQITESSLPSTELAAQWVSENGSVYALLVLDAQRFSDQVGEMTSLSEPIRQTLVRRAAEIFRAPESGTAQAGAL